MDTKQVIMSQPAIILLLGCSFAFCLENGTGYDENTRETLQEEVTLPPEFMVEYDVDYESFPPLYVCSPYTVCEPTCPPLPPQSGPQCAMCQQLGCGSAFDMRHNKHCSCDSECMFYGDCCADFSDVCPELHEEAVAMTANVARVPEPECILITGVSDVNKLKLVASCETGRCVIDDSSDGNPDHFPLPVTDLDTGVHYASLDCAKCNGATRMNSWGSTLDCNLDYDPSNVSRSQLIEWIVEGTCDLEIDKPDNSRYCMDDSSEDCDPATCRNLDAIEACHNASTQYVNFWGRNFRNFECALCSLDLTIDETDEMNSYMESGDMCGAFVYMVDLPPNRKGGEGPSLNILFDFTYSDGEAVSDVETKFYCTGDYGIVNGHCVQAFCPFGYHTRYLCQTSVSKVGFVALKVEFSAPDVLLLPEDEIVHIERKLLSIPEGKLRTELCELSFYGIPELNCYNSTQVGADRVEGEQGLTCNVGIVSVWGVLWTTAVESTDLVLQQMSTRATLLQLAILQTLSEELVNFTMTNFDVLKLSVTSSRDVDQQRAPPMLRGVLNFSMDGNGSNVTDCLRVKVSFESYSLENNSLKVESLSTLVPEEQFVIENDTAFVCKEFYEAHYDPKLAWLNRESRAMKITSVVALSLSVMFLLVRMLLQPVIPIFSTFPNRLQFCLCVTLCVAFLLFLLAPWANEHVSLCYIFGALIHWGFLATFFCMMAVALHMFKTFQSSSLHQPEPSKKLLVEYLVLAWLPPSVIVCMSVAVDFLPVDPYFQPQYGVPACWIGGKFAHLVYFGVPLGLVLLINVALLIGTSVNLHRAFSTSASVNKRSKSYELWLNIRLAVLLGSTWIIAFIASAVNNEVMWYIFIVLCGLQGVFVFVSFVCTKQVWKSLKEKYSILQSSSTGSSKPKTASTVVKYAVPKNAFARRTPAITVTVDGGDTARGLEGTAL